MRTHPENQQILELKLAQNGNRNKVLTTEPLISRGMTIEECKAICTASLMPLREKTFFRIIYETSLRPMEALNLEIENFNKETGELIARKTKGKHNRWIRQTRHDIRHLFVGENTREMLRTLIGNRKKGYIFESEEIEGKPISKRYMQEQINKWARLLSIQQVRRYAQSPTNPDDTRVLPLVTLMALRKAGERHHDANEGDSSLSAQAAGHTMKTKIKHYQGEQDWEAVHKSYQKHHPAFVEGW